VVGVLALEGAIPSVTTKTPRKAPPPSGGRRCPVLSARDFAQIRADGSIRLLGRGSGCINTAGEKVYPEEVEEVLKTHVAVADAAVVGVPDLNYGEQIVAAVECYDEAPDAAELIDHVKAHLAHTRRHATCEWSAPSADPFGQARLRPAPQRGPGLAASDATS